MSEAEILEVNGKQLSPEQLAAKMGELATYGKSKVAFIIGGSLGINDTIKSAMIWRCLFLR